MVDSFVEINCIINGSNNITLRKANVKHYGFDEIYMDKDLIEDKLSQIMDQLNKRKTVTVKFCSILLNEIHPFCYGNGRASKTHFANDETKR